MKKTLLMLAAGVAMVLGMSACGSSKDEPVEPATATYTVTLSQDTFDAGTYIVRFKDANNTNRFEVMTSTTWTKTVTTSRFPAQLGFKIDASVKNETELTKDNYSLAATGTIAIKRGVNSLNTTPLNFSAEVVKANVERIIDKEVDDVVVAYIVNSEGQATFNNKMSFE